MPRQPIHRDDPDKRPAPADALPAELLRIIEALAEAQAHADYTARFQNPAQV